jgi:stearoyl-CoA desaturase (delta-9 desaturase)
MDPVNTGAITLLHLGAISAFFLPFSWYELGLTAALWWLCGGLGVCLCYHRLLTHRSFKTPKVIEYAFTLLGTACWQGGPIKWVGTHRIHHKHSDDEGDPHSPHHGFNWAHILWCLMKEPAGFQPRDAAKDLQRDPVMVWIDRYHYVPQFALAAALLGLGWLIGGPLMGLSYVVWGVCIRTVFTFHATWFVNSAAHTWGYQSHDTGDDSKNNWWVALLSFGEGWHNNHHAAQRAAAHGRRWWEVDMTYWTIKAMSWVGLAREIVPVKA